MGHLRRAVLLVAFVALTTGCMTVRLDVVATNDETIDIAMTLAVDETLAALAGGPDALRQELASGFETSDLPDGASVTVEDVEIDGRIGSKFSITGVPAADFADTLGGDLGGITGTEVGSERFAFTPDADGNWTLDAYLPADSVTPTDDTGAMFGSPEDLIGVDFVFAFTAPGAPVTHNADRVEGSTLIWEIPLDGSDLEMSATWDASAATGGDGVDPALIVAAIAAVVLVASAAWYLASRRQRPAEPGVDTGDDSAAPPAPPAPQAPPQPF